MRIAEKLASGQRLLDLTSSNPTLSKDYPHERIARAYAAVHDFRYTPDPRGLLEAREAIATYHAEQGYEVDPTRILLTASSSEAYALLFKLFCDPGDEVLVPTPSYPLFEYLAAVEGVSPKTYPLRYDGSWYIDFEELRRRLGPRTRAVVVVSPNNPTGSVVSADEIRRLMELSREFAIPLIVDEVFVDYRLDESGERPPSFARYSDALTFSLNGLSKSAGMPQMKLGWIVVNGPVEERNAAVARLELLCDTFLSVATPVQKALPALMKIGKDIRTEIGERIRENYQAAETVLNGTAAHRLHGEAGWTAALQLPGTKAEEEWVELFLEEGGCVVQPGYFFDFDHRCVAVVSLLTDSATFRAGLENIRDVVTKHA